jgi:DDE family transposase
MARRTPAAAAPIDGRTTRHPGDAQNQRARQRIEEAFAWIKTIAGQARTRLRSLERVRWSFTLAAAAYHLIRLPRSTAPTAHSSTSC